MVDCKNLLEVGFHDRDPFEVDYDDANPSDWNWIDNQSWNLLRLDLKMNLVFGFDEINDVPLIHLNVRYDEMDLKRIVEFEVVDENDVEVVVERN